MLFCLACLLQYLQFFAFDIFFFFCFLECSYYEAVVNLIFRVQEAISRVSDNTVVIVTSDHGHLQGPRGGGGGLFIIKEIQKTPKTHQTPQTLIEA